MDVSTITNLVSRLNNIQNIAGSIVECKTKTEIRTRVVALQELAASVQQLAMAIEADRSALSKRVAELERESAFRKGNE